MTIEEAVEHLKSIQHYTRIDSVDLDAIDIVLARLAELEAK